MTRSIMRFIAVLLWLAGPAVVCAQALPQASPTAVEVLKKANEASQKLTSISYDGQYLVEGDFASKMPQITGKVIAARADGKPISLFIKGAVQSPGQTAQAPFVFATDGDQAFKIEEQSRTFFSGKLADARVSEVDALFPPKYFGNAFQDELTGASPTYEGAQSVDGAECDVLGFVDPRGSRAIRYFIGKKDSLLHRVENILRVTMPGAQAPSTSKIIFNAKGIETQAKTSADMFKLAAPDGYNKKVFQGSFTNAPQTAQGLLAAGTEAPDWELKTPDGKGISLKSLRGKVVVMDFWASWCGPSKMAMPGLQGVHEHFKDKPVVIVGIDCREHNKVGETAAQEFVRQKGLTYTQVVKGDSVAQAYGVSGIPCFYIIGPDGKVVFATSGFQPRLHDYMIQTIEGILPTKPSADATKKNTPAAP